MLFSAKYIDIVHNTRQKFENKTKHVKMKKKNILLCSDLNEFKNNHILYIQAKCEK